MSTVCTRSGLIENDDMPSSYFPPWMPGMMPEKALFWNSAVSPSFCAMAVPRSTSMPMIVVPSGAGELVRRVRRVRAEHDLAVRGDALRHLRGERVVLRRGGERTRRGGTRRTWAQRTTRCRCRQPRTRRGRRRAQHRRVRRGVGGGATRKQPPDGPWVRRGCSHFRPRRAHHCARVVTEHLSTGEEFTAVSHTVIRPDCMVTVAG